MSAMSVCGCVCLRHWVHFFFEASHWPSDHMIRSRPLIGQPPSLTQPLKKEEDFFDKSFIFIF